MWVFTQAGCQYSLLPEPQHVAYTGTFKSQVIEKRSMMLFEIKRAGMYVPNLMVGTMLGIKQKQAISSWFKVNSIKMQFNPNLMVG